MSKCFVVLADGQVIYENDVFRCEGEDFVSIRNKSELYAFPIFGEPEFRGISKLCGHIEMIGNIKKSIEKESKIMNTITNIKEFSKELNNYGYKVKMQSHVKNGKDMMALQAFKPGADNRLCPIIYVSNFEVDEFDAKTMARSVLAQVKDESERVSSYLDVLNDWDLMKPLLRICVRPKTKEDSPDIKRDFLDIEMYVRIFLSGDEGDEQTRSVVVTKDLCSKLHVTEDEVFDRAIFNVNEYMKQMDFSDVLPFASPDLGMNVLSAGGKTHGAGVMALLPLLLSESGYILPSSIHELLYIPEKRTSESTSRLRQIVREVNETAVDEQDFLSDSVYYYDADRKILILA